MGRVACVVDVCMDGWMYGWMYVCMDVCVDGWTIKTPPSMQWKMLVQELSGRICLIKSRGQDIK